MVTFDRTEAATRVRHAVTYDDPHRYGTCACGQVMVTWQAWRAHIRDVATCPHDSYVTDGVQEWCHDCGDWIEEQP